ncbi:MAG: hypothetical protein JY451_01585 [Erythrobacter sp.]|nr:MAG: hypothetical protein JY451_01585 [Erythrobacter sp.]
MKFPKLDLSSLPDLETLTGVFGTTTTPGGPGHNDTIIILATLVYDSAPPTGGLL